MIKYLRHQEIDTQKWDDCISRSVNGMIYAMSWYLDLVNDRWEALVQNDYESVMPLTPGRKLGISYLFQPRFTQQLGVFSRTHLTEKVVLEFINSIPHHYRFIEINLNTHNKLSNPHPDFTPWLTHELDLIAPYEQLAAGYSTNLKRNLKRAVKAGLTVMGNSTPENIIRIFRENKGRELRNLADRDYDLLRRLIYVMIYKKMAGVLAVFDETNDLRAGAFFVYSGRKAIFFFSGTDAHGRELRAMPLLIDHFIRTHAGSHLTLDFEGSNNPDLARFYKGFGATPVNYLHFRRSTLPFPLNAALAVKKKFFKY